MSGKCLSQNAWVIRRNSNYLIWDTITGFVVHEGLRYSLNHTHFSQSCNHIFNLSTGKPDTWECPWFPVKTGSSVFTERCWLNKNFTRVLNNKEREAKLIVKLHKSICLGAHWQIPHILRLKERDFENFLIWSCELAFLVKIELQQFFPLFFFSPSPSQPNTFLHTFPMSHLLN